MSAKDWQGPCCHNQHACQAKTTMKPSRAQTSHGLSQAARSPVPLQFLQGMLPCNTAHGRPSPDDTSAACKATSTTQVIILSVRACGPSPYSCRWGRACSPTRWSKTGTPQGAWRLRRQATTVTASASHWPPCCSATVNPCRSCWHNRLQGTCLVAPYAGLASAAGAGGTLLWLCILRPQQLARSIGACMLPHSYILAPDARVLAVICTHLGYVPGQLQVF